VNPHIGIHCEYLVTGTYRWRKIEYTTLDKIDKEQVANLSSNVIFGLSVYLKRDGRNP